MAAADAPDDQQRGDHQRPQGGAVQHGRSLAVRADWVNKNPKATIAQLNGVMEAQQWLDQAGNKAEAAKILSSRK